VYQLELLRGVMKKSLLIAAFILLGIISNSLGQYRRLANVGKYGLDAREFEQILRMNDADVDIATAALILSERWSDDVQGLYYRDKIDEMTSEILDRLEQSRTPINHQAVAVINKYLFEEMGFRSIASADNPEDLFIDSVIEKKRGYCLSLSVLYLSIAERLGLRIYGVVVPGHFFVRYDDGQTRFNIETTSGGKWAADEHYINKFKVPIYNGDSMYMRNLSNHETLGCYLNNLGNSYHIVDDIDTATDILEKAVRINPALAESRNNLGNMYLQKGLVQEAIRQYETALEINPNDSKSHNNLGNAFYRKGLTKKAIGQYKLAIELDPNSVDAYKNLASAYLQIENFKMALTYIKKAEILEPKNGGVYVIAGSIYAKMGQNDLAIQKLIKALVLDPDSIDSYLAIAVAYKNLGNEEGAIEAYRNALEIDSNSFVALANLGNIYFENKGYDKAQEYYEKAVSINPGDSRLHYNLGATHLNNESYEEAIESLEASIKIEKKNVRARGGSFSEMKGTAAAHHGLAFCYYKTGEYELANEHLFKADKFGYEIQSDLERAIKQKLK